MNKFLRSYKAINGPVLIKLTDISCCRFKDSQGTTLEFTFNSGVVTCVEFVSREDALEVHEAVWGALVDFDL